MVFCKMPHTHVQQDPTLNKNTGNVIKVTWAFHKIREPPLPRLGVSLKRAEPFIVQQKSENGFWIITTIAPSSHNSTNLDNVFFLYSNEEDVEWIDYKYELGELPPRRVRCHRAGEYGNMFVGWNGKEVGMVVNYEENTEGTTVKKWVFYTDKIEHRIEKGFQILCITNK